MNVPNFFAVYPPVLELSQFGLNWWVNQWTGRRFVDIFDKHKVENLCDLNRPYHFTRCASGKNTVWRKIKKKKRKRKTVGCMFTPASFRDSVN